MNLILAVFWLSGAVGVFAYEATSGDKRFRIAGLDISTGWGLLLLSAYNWIRYYTSRMGRGEAEAIRIAKEARLREIRGRQHAEYNPEFDFNREPPPSPRPPHDAPPSAN